MPQEPKWDFNEFFAIVAVSHRDGGAVAFQLSTKANRSSCVAFGPVPGSGSDSSNAYRALTCDSEDRMQLWNFISGGSGQNNSGLLQNLGECTVSVAIDSKLGKAQLRD